jgi:excisionase family DNA binding protein
MAEDSDLLTTKEAAEYLGVDPGTIRYHLYTSKYLKPYKVIGRTLVFTHDQLDELKKTMPAPGRKPKKRRKPATD